MAKKVRSPGSGTLIGYRGRGSKQKAQKAVKLLNTGGGRFVFSFFRTKDRQYYFNVKDTQPRRRRR